MSKQIRKRLEIIEDHFGKMALRDFVRVDGGPDTPLHKAAHSGKCSKLKVFQCILVEAHVLSRKGFTELQPDRFTKGTFAWGKRNSKSNILFEDWLHIRCLKDYIS